MVLFYLFRLFSLSALRNNLKQKSDDYDEENEPIKYSETKAAKWRAENTRAGPPNDAPWFQPYVISASLAVFMLYFFVLREESDVDKEFDKTLYDRISGLEQRQLEISIKYSGEQGLPTKELKDRLEEIKKNS